MEVIYNQCANVLTHIASSVSANMLSQYVNGAHKEQWWSTDHTMTHSCDCLICHVIILKLIILGEKKNLDPKRL